MIHGFGTMVLRQTNNPEPAPRIKPGGALKSIRMSRMPDICIRSLAESVFPT
jgi:hypothetical protein